MPRTVVLSLSVAVLLPGAYCAAMATGAESEVVQISRSGRGAYEASLAARPGEFAVAWHDSRHGLPEIYLRLVDDDGRAVAGEHRLTTNEGRSYEPSIAVSGRDVGGDIIVAWYDVAADDSSSVAKVGAWTAAGAPRWTRTLSDPRRRGRAVAVAVAGDLVQCVWIEETSNSGLGAGSVEERAAGGRRTVEARAVVRGQQLSLDGAPLGPPRRIADASPTTWNLNLRTDEDGVSWVVFDAQSETRAHELFLARVERDRVTVNRLSADDGAASVYPDLAVGAGRVAVTWWDRRDGNAEIYLAVLDKEALGSGIDREARRVTETAGESIGAYVAWNGTGFGLAWSDEVEPGRPHEIYFQRFTAAGVPERAPRRLTDNPTASLIPAIRAAGSRFALAWNEDVIEARGDHLGGGRSEVVFTFAR